MKKLLLMFLVCLMAFTSFSVITVNAQTENDSQEEIVEPTTSEVVSEQNGNNTRSGSLSIDYFALEVVNGTPVLPSDEDPSLFDYTGYEDLLRYVKRGDIIYEPKALTGVDGSVGHIATVLGVVHDATFDQDFILLLESFPPGGVSYGVLYPERYTVLNDVVKRFTNVSDNVIESAISWMMGQMGKAYDYLVFDKSIDANDSDWYCSELVWAAYYHQGIYMDTNDTGDGTYNANDGVLPWEINRYAGLTNVFQYNEVTTVEKNGVEGHKITCGENIYVEEHDYYELNSCYEKCSYCNYTHQIASHVYGQRFTNYNNPDAHYTYCQCGASKMESHTFVTANSINTCVDCGYSINVNHEHNYLYKPLSDGVNHSKKCSCGYSVTQPCIFQSPVGGGTSMCVFCKRLKPSGGGIIGGGGIFGIGGEEQTNSLGYVPTVQLNENSFYNLTK